MPKILVSGSLAYDQLYTFDGVFQDELLLKTDAHLSVAFNVEKKAVHFGGCSGNIVFNARLLKQDFVLFGIAGEDFDEYEAWLQKHSIDTSNIIRHPGAFTSHAKVVTDKKDQQMTFFDEGAARYSKHHKSDIKKIIAKYASQLTLAHIAPNNRDFMVATIDACHSYGIPFIFDPGQAMPLFTASELAAILKKSAGLIVNEYELQLFSRQSGMPIAAIEKTCVLLIVTSGEKGSYIYFKGKKLHIPAIKSSHPRDPTGCGDAYRAGFLASIQNYFPKLNAELLKKAGSLGAHIATSCLESLGTQNHHWQVK